MGGFVHAQAELCRIVEGVRTALLNLRPVTPGKPPPMPGKSPTTEESTEAGRRSSTSKRVEMTSSDRLLRQLVAAGDMLPWAWDLKLDRFRWAASPEWLLGAPDPDSGAYPDLRDLVHPQDRAQFLAATAAAREKSGSFHLEIRVLPAHGAARSVLVRGHSVVETGDTPTQINGVLIESVPHSNAPVANSALALQQSALLDSLPDLAWLKDARGCLVCVNLAFSKRYGIPREAAAGKTDFDIYPRDKAAQLRHEDSEIIATRTPMRYESWQDFDGERRWVEIFKAPVFDDAGSVVGTVGTSRDISARKAAERQLQDSERRFRMLAEMSSDWYWEQDADYHFTSITSRPDNVLNFKALIGKSRWEMPHADMSPERWRAHRATLDAHLPFHDFEYTSVQPNGAQRRFLTSGKPVYDEAGRFAGYRGIGTDITERRAAEAELRLAKERLELALQGSRLAIWDTDLATGAVYLSEAWSRMLSTTYGETRTTTAELMALVHPDDLAEATARSMETVRGERDEYMTEHRVRAADGSWRWIISRGRVSARDEHNRALRMSGTNLDITERKEMETSLGVALNRSEVLLQTTPTAIAVISDDVIRRCNPAMERLFGAAPGALYGQSTQTLFPSEDEWNTAGEKSRLAITQGETFSEQFEFVRADGEHFWAVVAARELEPGSPEILFTYTDVTAQQSLLRALVRAKELADAASQSKSSFLATMSHEIRTPMNGVLGMLELLGFSSLDKEQRESLDLARQSAVALLRLIDDILDFSKIEAGQLEICPEPVSLATLVNRAAAVYSELATHSKTLLLEHRVDPHIAPAHLADGLRLTQIINNLLSNAVKFTMRGKITLAIESLERNDAGELLRLRVTDTGIGITPEQQRRLFQPFMQADSNTTRTYGGTGLGLSICRRLAEKMGGEIHMDSEAGVGTVMTLELRLPLADPARLAVDDKARASIAAHSDTAAAGLLGVSILIADDHPINLRLIERQASLLGFDSTLAHDGVEALEKWQSGRFALLLTDCHMPRMDGYDLAREIRRIEAARGTTKPIPIIACTANAMEADANACYEAGMNDYLTKPTTLDALKSKIEHWITADASRTAATAAATAPVQTAAATGTPDEAPLDNHTLAEFTGGYAALRREILLQFLASNEPDALDLRSALAGDDCSAIAKAAHRVKGASRMIGAQPHAEVAERIEAAARAGDRAAVKTCISDFEREQARLAAYLQSETADA